MNCCCLASDKAGYNEQYTFSSLYTTPERLRNLNPAFPANRGLCYYSGYLIPYQGDATLISQLYYQHLKHPSQSYDFCLFFLPT